MGAVIAQLIARRGYAQQKTANDFEAAWQAAAAKVGVKNLTRSGRISRGVLEVFVANSAAHQLLAFQKQSLLTALKAAPGGAAIKDVRFKVGPIK